MHARSTYDALASECMLYTQCASHVLRLRTGNVHVCSNDFPNSFRPGDISKQHTPTAHTSQPSSHLPIASAAQRRWPSSCDHVIATSHKQQRRFAILQHMRHACHCRPSFSQHPTALKMNLETRTLVPTQGMLENPSWPSAHALSTSDPKPVSTEPPNADAKLECKTKVWLSSGPTTSPILLWDCLQD